MLAAGSADEALVDEG